MTTKERVIDLFRSNSGSFYSGEEIAAKLGLSRAAVWKTVKRLREEGYPILGVTKKGYCMEKGSDILSESAVRQYLDGCKDIYEINIIDTAGSTNDIVKAKAEDGVPEGFTVISNEQTSGKGRFGRSFFSPHNTGIYMSILLRPENKPLSYGNNITTIAAAAACEAIESISGKKTDIKWVNDIYIEGKKVCGILTEGAFDLESGMFKYAVVGIGINLYVPYSGFPESIAGRAGAVFERIEDDSKNRLVASFLESFYNYYSGRKSEHIKTYRSRCFVIGKNIEIINGNVKTRGVVKDIDDECRLMVKTESGDIITFSSGEIKEITE